jgi:hypothetical protein
MANAKNLVVPMFKVHTTIDKKATAENGRPMYKDMEVVEIRMAANRQTVGVFPAHEVWKWVDGPNGREPQTYAMRFEDQYKRFKSNSAQAMSGTPIEELPFLTQAKRYELKALNVYTAEALAALDGKPLANIGMGGRELKDQAQAYLDKAAGNADVLKLASENAELKRRLEALENARPLGDETGGAPAVTNSPFASWEADDIKAWIKDANGSLPRGNHNQATLVALADKINADLKAKSEQQAA